MKEVTGTKYVLFLALVVALLTGLVNVVQAAGTELTVSWLRTYDAVGLDRAYGVAVDSSDNIIVTGEINNNQDFGTIKYAPDGNVLWVETYDSTNQDVARDVAVDSQDNIIVSGIVMGPTAGQFDRNHTVIKYAPDGSVIWLRQHNSLSPTYYSSHLAVDTLDNIISTRSIEITKYDSSGNIIWNRDTWIGPWGQYMTVFNVATDSNDNILVTGAIYLNNGPSWYVATAKYRGSDGALLWYVYDPATLSSGRSSIGMGVAVDSFNNVIITGYMPNGNYLTKKYDPNGVELWTVIDSEGYRAQGVAVDSSDNIFVTGWNAYSVKYAPDGSLLWSDQFIGPNPYVQEYYGQDIALDSSENMIVAGWYKSTQYPSNEGYFTLKYTTSVNQVPAANNQSVITGEDTSAAVILTATEVDGDPLTYDVLGGPTNGTLSGTAPNLTYTPNLNYYGPDSFTFIANDGNVDSNIATVSITVTAVNDAPVADDQLVITDEDTAVATILTASDVDGDPLTYSIVDGPTNGTLVGTAPNLTYTPSLNYYGPDTFTFTANDGSANSNIAAVTIDVNPVNDPPVANDDSVTTDENVPVDIDVLANDSDIDGGMLTVASVTQGSKGTVTINLDNTVNYAPDPGFSGTDSFTYSASDGSGGIATATVTVTVIPANQPPTANAGGPYNGNEGSLIALDSASASDPDGDSLTFSWNVSTSLCSFSGANTLNPTLTCDDDGEFTVTLTISDGTESVSSDTLVTVYNMAPTVSSIIIAPDPAVMIIGSEIAASANFSDPGTADTHTAIWEWGDDNPPEFGTITQGVGSGSVTGSHTYNASGVYTVILTVSDDDSGENESVYQFVVIYDPNGGFVTGGGWIWSPAGAYLLDPSLEGKASFGFVSKYKNGASMPSGNTEFQFKASDLNFHSSTYDWLVVTGSDYARFKGAGTINGLNAPNGDPYRFMIWAGDGDPDTFRIRIWWEDGDTEIDVYDNGMDEQIEGGNIVVHTN